MGKQNRTTEETHTTQDGRKAVTQPGKSHMGNAWGIIREELRDLNLHSQTNGGSISKNSVPDFYICFYGETIGMGIWYAITWWFSNFIEIFRGTHFSPCFSDILIQKIG